MHSKSYDAIVLGTGGVGSAALWQLASRGARVLGIDRFDPPHDRGSSHGQTRIIRQAYFEHPDYVPLLVESYSLWRQLESQCGEELVRETGLLQVGPPDGVVVPGVLRSAARHGLDVEALSAAEVERRWPAFRVPGELEAVYERRGGLLHVERCVAACLTAARRAGGETLANVEVFDWTSDGGGVRVRTSAGEFATGRLIVAAGAWAGRLLVRLGLPLEVRRKVVMWHDASRDAASANAGYPAFLFELSRGVFYGLPAIDERGVKVGDHSRGETVADPLAVDRSLRPADRAPVERFLREHLTAAMTPCRDYSVCLYTMSPDEHFIIDRDPEDERVAFAAGLSGHGYKFAPVLGKALAELALEGRTALPIGFLALARFASRRDAAT